MLMVESLPERQEATGTLPGDTDAGRAIFKSLFYHDDTDTVKHILECSLLPIGTGSLPAHQWASRSPRFTWATQRAVQGTSSTHQQPHASQAHSQPQRKPTSLSSGTTVTPGGRALHPTGSGLSAQPTTATTAAGLTTEGHKQPTQRATLEHTDLVTRAECAPGPQRRSPT